MTKIGFLNTVSSLALLGRVLGPLLILVHLLFPVVLPFYLLVGLMAFSTLCVLMFFIHPFGSQRDKNKRQRPPAFLAFLELVMQSLFIVGLCLSSFPFIVTSILALLLGFIMRTILYSGLSNFAKGFSRNDRNPTYSYKLKFMVTDEKPFTGNKEARSTKARAFYIFSILFYLFPPVVVSLCLFGVFVPLPLIAISIFSFFIITVIQAVINPPHFVKEPKRDEHGREPRDNNVPKYIYADPDSIAIRAIGIFKIIDNILDNEPNDVWTIPEKDRNNDNIEILPDNN